MWFKNLIVFRFEEVPEFDEEAFEKVLAGSAFRHCSPQQPQSLGWTPPMGNLSEKFCHAGNGFFLLTARREERILPGSVVREAVEDKVVEIELREERRVGRKQRMEIRDQLIFEMMPRAFTRSIRIQGMILPAQQMLVVDTVSRSRAEEWVSLLRYSLGSLEVKPLSLKNALPALFNGWLSGNSTLPNQIAPGNECVLQSMEDKGAVVRCRNQDLFGNEISAHLEAGKVVTQLAIEWNDSLSFVLNENVEIKRLRFSDTLVEQVEQDGVNDEAAEFDARFALLGLELSQFLPALCDVLGGHESET